MSKIKSSFFGMQQLAQLFDIVNPVRKGKRNNGNVKGDKFYNGLSWKRRDGKWRVKK